MFGALFLGVQAAVLAIVLRAVHRIGEHILVDRWLWAVAVASAAAALVGVSFWIVLPAAGAAYAAATARSNWLLLLVLAIATTVAALALTNSSAGATAAAAVTAPTTLALFVAGLKGGLLTFGGAYTAIPFVRNDTVSRGWMTDAQFLDGIALSGVLPAPLVIFATFVGWMSGGLPGALAITAGMFLPAFAFSLILYERLEAIAEHQRLQTVLLGVAAAVVGLIAVTLIELGRAAADHTPGFLVSVIIFAAALAIIYCWKSKLSTPLVLALGGASVRSLSGDQLRSALGRKQT